MTSTLIRYDSPFSPFSQVTPDIAVRRSPDFHHALSLPWRLTAFGAGQARQVDGRLRLALMMGSATAYSDAQISDYAAPRDFTWRPPARLEVTAWAEPEAARLRGTAGFGFWNQPFMPGARGFRLPQAAWFFFSAPPSDMRLALDVPGPGWKAAALDARRAAFLALLPAAPIGVLLMRIPALYRRLWPVGQWALGVSEQLLDARLLAERHTYALDWRPDGLTFAVDGAIVHRAPHAPRGPLGFIAWLDNQYAVVTPQGRFRFGLTPIAEAQALIIESITLSTE